MTRKNGKRAAHLIVKQPRPLEPTREPSSPPTCPVPWCITFADDTKSGPAWCCAIVSAQTAMQAYSAAAHLLGGRAFSEVRVVLMPEAAT